MKDVVYAGFSQLSYLNWHLLKESILIEMKDRRLVTLFGSAELFDEIKTPFYDKMIKGDDGDYYLRKEEDKKIYSAMDKRIFYLYSEDPINAEKSPKYPEFQEWEFLCGYDHKKILKEAGNIIDIDDSGFQASAFKKGNKVIIAYRGSDDLLVKKHRKTDWIKTNLKLGFNKHVDQLTCVAWFYEKIKKIEPNTEIHITGHSLGGALAQFAHIYSGSKHQTKTWNGLGIGEANKMMNIHSSENLNILNLKKVLIELNYLDGEDWTGKCKNSNMDNVLKKYVDEYTVSGYDYRKEEYGKNTDPNLTEKEIKGLKKELEYKLNMMYVFQKNYNVFEENDNLENIYFEKDLTPNLQTRKGIIKKADTESEAIEIDDKGSGFFRKLISFFIKNPGEFHSIPNFLPFLDESGNIKKGDLNDIYVSNAVKTLIQNDKKLLEKAKNDLMARKKVIEYPRLLKEKLGEIVGVVELNEIPEKYEDENFLLLELLKEEIKNYEKKWYRKNDEYAFVGSFTNYGELGGVIGGTPLKVKMPIDLIKKLEGKIDIPSLNFFEKYDEKYGLKADNLPPYYYARVLLEADKKKKVYLGELAYKLFVTERSRIGKLENQNQVKAFQKTFEEIKEIFEEIIEGYTKESYETENEFVWTGLGNQKRLLSDLGILRMTKTKDYVKSYSETEAEKEAREKRQEKLKKEIDAEEMSKLEKESKIRIKKLDEEKESREIRESTDVDTKKTKYINCRKGSVSI